MDDEVDNCTLPIAAAAEPVMATDAVAGLPSVEPTGVLSFTVNERGPGEERCATDRNRHCLGCSIGVRPFQRPTRCREVRARHRSSVARRVVDAGRARGAADAVDGDRHRAGALHDAIARFGQLEGADGGSRATVDRYCGGAGAADAGLGARIGQRDFEVFGAAEGRAVADRDRNDFGRGISRRPIQCAFRGGVVRA